MIIGENLTYADIFQLLEQVEIQLVRKINPTFYTPLEWLRKSEEGNNFVIKVLEQPKIFLIGTDNEFVKLRQSSKNK